MRQPLRQNGGAQCSTAFRARVHGCRTEHQYASRRDVCLTACAGLAAYALRPRWAPRKHRILGGVGSTPQQGALELTYLVSKRGATAARNPGLDVGLRGVTGRRDVQASNAGGIDAGVTAGETAFGPETTDGRVATSGFESRPVHNPRAAAGAGASPPLQNGGACRQERCEAGGILVRFQASRRPSTTGKPSSGRGEVGGPTRRPDPAEHRRLMSRIAMRRDASTRGPGSPRRAPTLEA